MAGSHSRASSPGKRQARQQESARRARRPFAARRSIQQGDEGPRNLRPEVGRASCHHSLKRRRQGRRRIDPGGPRPGRLELRRRDAWPIRQKPVPPRFDLSEGRAARPSAAASERRLRRSRNGSRRPRRDDHPDPHRLELLCPPRAATAEGGVEASLNLVRFETTQKEMGDEGRLPPHLNGVGRWRSTRRT